MPNSASVPVPTIPPFPIATGKGAPSRTRRLPIWKRVLYGMIPAAVLFGSLEGTLRAIGFEFRPWVIDQDILRPAGEGTLRTAKQFRDTEPYGFNFCVDQTVMQEKLAGTLRVVIVGESSVVKLGTADVLRAELERGTGTPVEFVNLGMSAASSVRILRAAREAIRLDPDVLLIYMGHNELRPLITESSGGDVRLLQWLTKLWLQKTQPNSRITGNVIHHAASRQQSYDQFRENLTAIVKLARIQGVEPVVGVPAANIMWSPLCWPSPSLKPTLDLTFEELESIREEHRGNPFWEFDMAERLYYRQEYGRSKERYESALLHDPATGRADRAIRSICREVAAERNAPLADICRLIEERSTGGIPGATYFDDWCHLNELGNDLLQREFAKAVLPGVANAGKRGSKERPAERR